METVESTLDDLEFDDNMLGDDLVAETPPAPKPAPDRFLDPESTMIMEPGGVLEPSIEEEDSESGSLELDDLDLDDMDSGGSGDESGDSMDLDMDDLDLDSGSSDSLDLELDDLDLDSGADLPPGKA
jgi:hypothetical protein